MRHLILLSLAVLRVSGAAIPDKRGDCPITLTPGNYSVPKCAVPMVSSHPKSFANRECSLYFSFPTRIQQVNSSYFGAPDAGGSLRFSELWIDPNPDWTYNDVLETRVESGIYAAAPGNVCRIAGSHCAIGRTLGFEISSVAGYNLTLAQSTDICPMGLFILSHN